MPRRVRRPRKDDDDGEPITISQSEQEAFDVELKDRVSRWSEAYSDSTCISDAVVEQLPLELQRSFNLMKELDRHSEGRETQITTDGKAEIGALWQHYCAERNCGPLAAATHVPVKHEHDEASQSHRGPTLNHYSTGNTTSPARRQKLLSQIYTTVQNTVSMSEEKLALAVAAYDSVDRQIRRLDTDLLKNERSLHAGLRRELTEDTADSSGTAPLPLASDRFSPEGQLLTFWSGLISLDPLTCLAYLKEHLAKDLVGEPTPARAGHKRTTPQQAPPPDTNPMARIPETEVDPSEPRYCYCDRVSYGEMVACDNDDCPREWVRCQSFVRF